ncbi:MAG: hypothetical protein HYY06_17510 [Deltaproteobacteria bacterium]|nr:hypothetical protein [Deltaproteobacteria bacterium]
MALACAMCTVVDAPAQSTEEVTSPPEAATSPAALPSGPAEPGADSEEAEIAAELARIQSRGQPESTARTAPPATAAGGASPYGLSNFFNPALSANAIALGGGSTRESTGDEPRETDLSSGIFVQEVEIRASAIVDPYFRADVSLNGNAEEVGFEEAILSTLEIPRLTIRAGQMRAVFGRHTLLHTHAFPFVTAPLPIARLFGPEGLEQPGVAAEVLLPLPFYAEVSAQAFQGDWPPFEGGVAEDPDKPPEDLRRDEDLAYVGHLKTLFDLGASATVEIGGTYLGGRNVFGRWTSVVGGDLTLKWRPIEAERYRGIDWTTEWIWQSRPGAPLDRRIGGGYSALRAQFAQRWWVQARGAVLGLLPRGDDGRTFRAETLVAFVPSEFSAIRLQYALEKAEGQRWVNEVFLQAIFSVGAHPAHAY